MENVICKAEIKRERKKAMKIILACWYIIALTVVIIGSLRSAAPKMSTTECIGERMNTE